MVGKSLVSWCEVSLHSCDQGIEVICGNLLRKSSRNFQPNSFEMDEKLMLKVSPWNRIIHFGNRGRLGPSYISELTMLDRIGDQAYRLKLPPKLKGFHDLFHVCYLWKCLIEEMSILPLDELRVDELKHLVEEPKAILDHETK